MVRNAHNYVDTPFGASLLTRTDKRGHATRLGWD